MFCTKCGEKYSEEVNFCPNCGTDLTLYLETNPNQNPSNSSEAVQYITKEEIKEEMTVRKIPLWMIKISAAHQKKNQFLKILELPSKMKNNT